MRHRTCETCKCSNAAKKESCVWCDAKKSNSADATTANGTTSLTLLEATGAAPLEAKFSLRVNRSIRKDAMRERTFAKQSGLSLCSDMIRDLKDSILLAKDSAKHTTMISDFPCVGVFSFFIYIFGNSESATDTNCILVFSGSISLMQHLHLLHRGKTWPGFKFKFGLGCLIASRWLWPLALIRPHRLPPGLFYHWTSNWPPPLEHPRQQPERRAGQPQNAKCQLPRCL